jgi:hypothetical protein
MKLVAISLLLLLLGGAAQAGSAAAASRGKNGNSLTECRRPDTNPPTAWSFLPASSAQHWEKTRAPVAVHRREMVVRATPSMASTWSSNSFTIR